MLDACMQFENYPIKTVEEAFYSYHILYHYFKISKIRQKFKNRMIVKKSTSHVRDIILEACMQIENYPIKTVGGEAFYSYHTVVISKNVGISLNLFQEKVEFCWNKLKKVATWKS